MNTPDPGDRLVGDVMLVLRRAANLTQEELSKRVGITQAALSRYEHNLRTPRPEDAASIADALGVTPDFLMHPFRLDGAIAADAHMRRQKTTKPSDWKRVEARLNALRMHSSFLLERLPLSPRNFVPRLDAVETSPSAAADIVRSSWRLPIGAVRNLTRWVESAAVIVIEEDFGTRRIDGMSQWAGGHAVIIVNAALPTDRKRLTIAHELGHLVLHSNDCSSDMEDEANEFAAEFLMPKHVIEHQLGQLTLGKLQDLKLEWGVSMQALFERAYRMGKVSADQRRQFYIQMSKRGWRASEPGSDLLPPEEPELARSIGASLEASGLSDSEISRLLGVLNLTDTPFHTQRRRLRAI